MTKRNKFGLNPDVDPELRKAAESKIPMDAPESLSQLDEEEIKQLVHNLQVHQVELEIQNEHLREAQHELLDTQSVLRQSNLRFQQLYDLAPVAYVVVDDRGLIRQTNHQFQQMVGLRPSAMEGKAIFDFFTPQSQYTFRTRFNAYFRNPVGKTLDLHLGSFSGTTYEILANGVLWEWDSRETPLEKETLLLMALNDVSTLRRKEDQLRRSERALRQAQRIARMGSWDWDVAKQKISWSDEMYHLFGVSKNSYTPTIDSFLEFAYPDDKVRLERNIPLTLNGKLSEVSYRIVPDHSEQVIHVQARMEVIKDDKNNPIFVSGSLHDITEQEQKNEELHQAKALAEYANKAKSDLLARVSHELRTPMNAIIGFSQLLELSENLNAEEREGLKHIQDSADHLLNLINEVLDISAVDAGRIKLDPEHFQLQNVMDVVLSLVKSMAYKAKITLENNVKQVPLWIYADVQRTKQILLNLLSNAIKYNRPNGSVILDAFVDGDRVTICVRDTGIGIRQTDLNAVFEPFSRFNRDIQDVQGTGIGLNIVKQLTESMGGSIAFDSAFGEGTEFRVSLPIGTEQYPVPEQAEENHDTDHWESSLIQKTVLYVEDNATNRNLMEQSFHAISDATLYMAKNAEEGLLQAKELVPDLILMDIDLPGMNGYEALDELHKNPRLTHIPVVAVTALATREELARLQASSFTRYLTKPLELAKLKTLLETLLVD